MTVKPGDTLPASEFSVMTPDGSKRVNGDQVFAGKRVVLFAVPGAFTSTCTKHHFPGYLGKADEVLAKGVDTIACTAVNDVHVMHAWSEASGNAGKIVMLSDGNGDFARAVGLDIDLSGSNMGLRSRRYSMILDNGVVTTLNVEDKPGVNVSGVDTMLTQL